MPTVQNRVRILQKEASLVNSTRTFPMQCNDNVSSEYRYALFIHSFIHSISRSFLIRFLLLSRSRFYFCCVSRSCGGVYCNGCSSHRLPVDHFDATPVRVCDQCYKGYRDGTIASTEPVTTRITKYFNAINNPSQYNSNSSNDYDSSSATSAAIIPSLSTEPASLPSGEILHLYHTHSLCARCSFIDRIGFFYKPAIVYQHTDSIYLKSFCEIHKETAITRICKDAKLWHRIMRFTGEERDGEGDREGGEGGEKGQKIQDLEEVGRQISLKNRNTTTNQPSSSASSSVTPTSASSPLPLTFDLTLFRDDSFLSDSEIDLLLSQFTQHLSVNESFVLKLNGGLIEKRSDILTLNDKIHRLVDIAEQGSHQQQQQAQEGVAPGFGTHRTSSIITSTSSTSSTSDPDPSSSPSSSSSAPHPLSSSLRLSPILIDLSFERLIDLCRIPHSVLLRGRVYPLVRYYLSAGDESQFINEMDALLLHLSTIEPMQLVVSLSVDVPIPDMGVVVKYLQQQVKYIRFIVVSRERAPNSLFKKLLQPVAFSSSSLSDPPISADPAAADPESSPSIPSTDPFDLLVAIEQGSDGDLKSDDFIPLRAASMLSPLLSVFGYGSFSFLASSFCAFTAVTIPSPFHSNSSTPPPPVSIARLFDLHRLYHELKPLLTPLMKSNSSASSFSSSSQRMTLPLAKGIQRALKSSRINGTGNGLATIPDLFSYIMSTESSRSESIKEMFQQSQVWIIHNKMDFAAVDLKRRCECAQIMTSPWKKNEFVATCTGCI